MAHKYVLDTHALIWFVEGNRRLGERAREILSANDSQLVLPIIALAEAVLVIERGRTTISSVSRFLNRVFGDPRIEIFPLTLDIFERGLTAAGSSVPELHDRFIVSTGLFLQDNGDSIETVTKDQTITDSGLLHIIW